MCSRILVLIATFYVVQGEFHFVDRYKFTDGTTHDNFCNKNRCWGNFSYPLLTLSDIFIFLELCIIFYLISKSDYTDFRALHGFRNAIVALAISFIFQSVFHGSFFEINCRDGGEESCYRFNILEVLSNIFAVYCTHGFVAALSEELHSSPTQREKRFCNILTFVYILFIILACTLVEVEFFLEFAFAFIFLGPALARGTFLLVFFQGCGTKATKIVNASWACVIMAFFLKTLRFNMVSNGLSAFSYASFYYGSKLLPDNPFAMTQMHTMNNWTASRSRPRTEESAWGKVVLPPYENSESDTSTYQEASTSDSLPPHMQKLATLTTLSTLIHPNTENKNASIAGSSIQSNTISGYQSL